MPRATSGWRCGARRRCTGSPPTGSWTTSCTCRARTCRRAPSAGRSWAPCTSPRPRTASRPARSRRPVRCSRCARVSTASRCCRSAAELGRDGTSPDVPGSGVDTDRFDAFVDGLDYPMFVVTTAHGGERAGCLVGFTTQASIDPPRMLVCLSVANHTYQVARQAELLAVHVLDKNDHDLAELFGGRTGDEVDKFAKCRWTPGPDGVPLLEDCPRLL